MVSKFTKLNISQKQKLLAPGYNLQVEFIDKTLGERSKETANVIVPPYKFDINKWILLNLDDTIKESANQFWTSIPINDAKKYITANIKDEINNYFKTHSLNIKHDESYLYAHLIYIFVQTLAKNKVGYSINIPGQNNANQNGVNKNNANQNGANNKN